MCRCFFQIPVPCLTSNPPNSSILAYQICIIVFGYLRSAIIGLHPSILLLCWAFALSLSSQHKMSSRSTAQILLPTSLPSQENTYRVPFNGFDGDESDTSLDTVHRTRRRNPSLSSADSYGSFGSGRLRVRNANIPPSQSPSTSNLYFPGSTRHLRPSSKQSLHKSSWANEIPVPPKLSNHSSLLHEAGAFEDVDLNIKGERGDDTTSTYNFIADPYLSLQVTQEMVARSSRDQENFKPSSIIAKPSPSTSHPLRRLISTLRRKDSKKIGSLKVRRERWSLDDFEETGSARPALARRQTINSHRKTPSWSSSGFVEAVKSATVGLGASNAVPSGRRNRKSILRNSDVSSRLSYSGNRASIDSGHGSTHLIDEATWARAIQRRRTLEELVSSEESYISDLKVLVNVVSQRILILWEGVNLDFPGILYSDRICT
jgi:hypothetical protein